MKMGKIKRGVYLATFQEDDEIDAPVLPFGIWFPVYSRPMQLLFTL